jgi:hypothetical protein
VAGRRARWLAAAALATAILVALVLVVAVRG